MSNDSFDTENEVKTLLTNLVTTLDGTPHIFVFSREQDKNSTQRVVTFCIQTKEGNEKLVNAIVSLSLSLEKGLRFSKSEVVIENATAVIDYLFIEANIMPCLNN